MDDKSERQPRSTIQSLRGECLSYLQRAERLLELIDLFTKKPEILEAMEKYAARHGGSALRAMPLRSHDFEMGDGFGERIKEALDKANEIWASVRECNTPPHEMRAAEGQ